MESPYKTIADDSKREILKQICKKNLSAGEIAKKYDISKPTISNHLKILQEAKLVSSDKKR